MPSTVIVGSAGSVGPTMRSGQVSGWRTVYADTGEILRDLILDPTRDYQPLSAHPDHPEAALNAADAHTTNAHT